MVFSSVTFLFYFLPVALTCVYLLRRAALVNPALLILSLVFYLWGEERYTAVMAVSIALNYIAGLGVGAGNSPLIRKVSLGFAIGGNLALFGYFKYFDFLLATAAQLFDFVVERRNVHLPLGISFFTFQAMSYVFDVYWKVTPSQRRLDRLALFITLFPQLVAGPIVRYHDIVAQIVDRRVTRRDFAAGIVGFSIGLGKKVLVANPLGAVVDRIFSLDAALVSFELAWLGAILYALQLYFDFSGYSDMAVGLGRMMGFKFPENFRYPYIARSIQDFWRRWHITLSTWFRDYLYIPLGGNRHSAPRTYLNLAIVFLLCGFWHGAAWTFVVWGAYHGSFLILERLGLSHVLASLPRSFQHAYALVVILVGWVVFRAETVDQAALFIGRMFNPAAAGAGLFPLEASFTNEVWAVLAVSIVASTPIAPWLASRIAILKRRAHGINAALYTGQFLAVAAILIGAAMSLAAETHNPFLYFRF